ncbi:DNA polymerase I [Succinimonas amylolytica]|uniref:DNA polymerase I n=1 Tax=Succinimonas amylolytica TaxID=83769 RepID=UPI0023A8C097
MIASIILVDGNNFLYRAYYSTIRAGMTNSNKEPTGAVRVYINMLNKLLKKYPGASLAVVFDAHGPSFRKELYPEYKATRKPMPDDLKKQLPWIRRYIEASGYPLIEVPGVEADDVLGSYAVSAEEQGISLIIESGDKDLAQLVARNVRIEDTMNGVVLDRSGVIEKFGVPPELIRDFLTLKGDKVDNVPGMTGIGDKSAQAVLNSIGDLDAVMEHLDDVEKLKFRGAGTFKDRFLKEIEKIRLSRVLVTIKTDVPLPVPLTVLASPNIPNPEKLMEIYRECGFKEAGNNFDDVAGEQLGYIPRNDDTVVVTEEKRVLDEPSLEIITAEDSFASFTEKLRAVKEFSLVIIPGEGHFEVRKPVGYAVRSENLLVYIPVGHQGLSQYVQLSGEVVYSGLREFIESSGYFLIGYDVKALWHLIRNVGGELKAPFCDVMLDAHILDSGQDMKLTALSEKYLGQSIMSEDDFLGRSRSRVAFCHQGIPETASYAAAMASAVFRIAASFKSVFRNDKVLADICRSIEYPLVRVLMNMERTGVLIDTENLRKQARNLRSKLADAENLLNTKAGFKVNINSSKQVGELLFEVLGLPGKTKTKSGTYSTSEDVLNELALNYEEPRLILDCRGYSKLLSTYVEKLPDLILPETGRIHGSFNQTGTVTGRLSSCDPNLQNIPIRSPEGREVRRAFIASPGYSIMAVDYSQIELRLMAHIANELNMVKAFNSGKDIHSITASEMHGVSLSEVTPELRRASKAINFGLIYGMSAFGLAKQLGIDTALAKRYVDNYFRQYPGVKVYMQKTADFAKDNGYVTTISGRKIMFAGLLRDSGLNAMQKKGLERAAINAPMQGSAADIIKKAMIKIDEWIQNVPEGTIKLLLQVHDELVFEVKSECAEEYARWISQIMTGVENLRVPLEVSVGIGENWSDAH